MSKNTLDSEDRAVRPLTTARIPTRDGEFQLTLYENSEDEKDHLALIYGDISGGTNVLVRIHSECFTGDVLGSLRCDCGEQLSASMRMIADHGSGIVLYLRQEGRGIGLLSKLKAYNLQDEGYDTVEANLALGHGADERDYTIGAHILEDLGVSSVRLITNNPEKIEGLEEADIEVIERIPIPPLPNEHNLDYLHTKVDRMRHMMELGPGPYRQRSVPAMAIQSLHRRIKDYKQHADRPFVTLSYIQGLDGSIVAHDEQRFTPENAASKLFVHRLRVAHDAVLMEIEAFLASDLAFARPAGEEAAPQPVVLDPQLQFPVMARFLRSGAPKPIIVTNEQARPDQVNALEEVRARILRVPCHDTGLSLEVMLERLKEQEVDSLLVEGGANLAAEFIRQQLVDHVAVIVTPHFSRGGPSQVEDSPSATPPGAGVPTSFPALDNLSYQQLGKDVLLRGDPA